MDKHQILMDMRNEHTLKGLKPCFVFIDSTKGELCKSGSSDYIMSLKNGILYFQKLGMFFHNLKPKGDFSYSVKLFSEYKIENKGKYKSFLYLYTEEGQYLSIMYQRNMPDSYATEQNIIRIIDEMKQSGLKSDESDRKE